MFDTPQTNVGDVFYKRLLSSYNFVIVDVTASLLDNPEAHCYVWDETKGKRGTNEVGSCLRQFCVQAAQQGVRAVNFVCDGCGGQQRNTYIASVCDEIVNTTSIEVITVTFLVKGHTENEADTTHSVIERDSKKKKVFLPSEWATIIRNTPTDKFKITVHELVHTDFIDVKYLKKSAYKNFRKDIAGEVILNWMKLRVFRVEKGTHLLQFKKHHSEKEFQSINMMQRGKGRRARSMPYEKPVLKNAYDDVLPIPQAKFYDLNSLCEGNKPVIPRRYHEYYHSLKHD